MARPSGIRVGYLGVIVILDAVESEGRKYCRTRPVVSDRAEGSWVTDENGNRYIDFFAGAGGIDYGRNNPLLRDELLDHITGNRVVHSLDMSTELFPT
jgi:diaminobutyrate-2-oxoglutarate transaminase